MWCTARPERISVPPDSPKIRAQKQHSRVDTRGCCGAGSRRFHPARAGFLTARAVSAGECAGVGHRLLLYLYEKTNFLFFCPPGFVWNGLCIILGVSPENAQGGAMHTLRPRNTAPDASAGLWSLPQASLHRSPADVVASLTALRMHRDVFSHAAAVLFAAAENASSAPSETPPACR